MFKGKITEEIKERLSIEEVVSSYIKLEKGGRNLKAVCPFHNEKTPSFVVSPERQSFYCFGCSKGGDIFTFVEEFEGVDFKESLRILADRAGVDLSKYQFEKGDSIKDDLFGVLEKATIFFEKNLQKNEIAKKYLADRGVSETTISKFRIGFASDGWQELIDYLKKEGTPEEEIIQAGLAIRNEKGRVYDRFRGRVIFPIFNERGKVVAYSARIINNQKDPSASDRHEPKYINSPETDLFNKSKILYGFNFAKPTIRKHDFVILVEGQMDVLMAHQAGYTNTVASSGTSFTEDQLEIIKRHTKNLLIAFDGDSAGISSGKKVWELAIKNDLDVKILPLASGEDPAEIIQKDKDRWRELVKSSQHIVEYFANNILNTEGDKRKQLKRLQIEIYPYLVSMNSMTERSYFVDLLAEKFGVDKVDIVEDVTHRTDEDMENKVGSRTGTIGQSDKVVGGSLSVKEVLKDEDILLGIYYWQKKKEKKDIEIEEYKKIIESEISNITFGDDIDEKLIFEVEKIFESGRDIKQFIDELITNIKIKDLQKKRGSIRERLQKFKGDSDEERNLMKGFEDLTKEIKDLEKEGCHILLKVL